MAVKTSPSDTRSYWLWLDERTGQCMSGELDHKAPRQGRCFVCWQAMIQQVQDDLEGLIIKELVINIPKIEDA